MSEENIELLRPVYEQWSQGNFRPHPDVYGPEMEWGWSDEFPDLGRPQKEPGEKSVRLQRWLSSWHDWKIEVEDYVASGDHVVVLCRYSGKGSESGVSVEAPGAHLWTIRDGRGVRLEVFSSRERALAAAGLDS